MGGIKFAVRKRIAALLSAVTLLSFNVPIYSAGAQDAYHETFANGLGAAKVSGGAKLSQVTDKAFDGNEDKAALYVSNRTNNWDAADFNFSDIGLENGQKYTVTVKGFVDSDVTVPAGAQAALQTNKSYAWLGSADIKAGAAFTITADYTVDTGKDTALRVQTNEAGKTVSYYVGDITVTKQASSSTNANVSNTVTTTKASQFKTLAFEDKTTDGFAGRAGKETLTATNEADHTSGSGCSLKVTGRTVTWHGPSLNVEKYIDQGNEYSISAWVKMLNPESGQLSLSTQIGNGNGASYINLDSQTVTSGGWVQLKGKYRYTDTSSGYITIYIESSNATASFYVDDVALEKTGAGVISLQKDIPSIKDTYKDFLIGDAISEDDMKGVRLELVKKHCNVVTEGNAMKPGSVQPTKGHFDFTAADKILDAVKAAGLKIHGHVLVWHQQTGEWMNQASNGKPLKRKEALDNLTTHIKTVMEHFGGKVISWDVVNEAMNDNPPNPSNWKASLRKTPWYNAIGEDYVEQAFLAARKELDAHPEWGKIRLYYNDYNEDNQPKATAIYNMVKELNEKYAKTHPGKLLVDGIGMQAHYQVNTNPANVKLTLEKFASLGVKVSITELDIQAGSDHKLSDKLAKAQGYLYAQLMDIFKAHAKDIERVTFWGLDDGTSWRSSSNPTPFNSDLQAKPAFYGVINPPKFMKENAPDTPKDANQSTAIYGTPVVDGTVDDIWKDAPVMKLNRYQMAWQGATGTAKAMWDDKNLYILAQISDSKLDKSSKNVWEQDSIEVFVDQNNGKTTFYQDDDGQYRVNFDNAISFNPDSIAAGVVSATKVSGESYVVEIKIPLKSITPKNDVKIGFDVQINDAKDGARQSAAAWNDITGNGYQDTSVFGVLTLTGKK